MHCLGAECCCRVGHQGYVIAEFGAAAGGRLDTGVRYHSHHDDFFDAALLELEVEVGIAARSRRRPTAARVQDATRRPTCPPRRGFRDRSRSGRGQGNAIRRNCPRTTVDAVRRTLRHQSCAPPRRVREDAQLARQRLQPPWPWATACHHRSGNRYMDRRAIDQSGLPCSHPAPKVYSPLHHVGVGARFPPCWVKGGAGGSVSGVKLGSRERKSPQDKLTSRRVIQPAHWKRSSGIGRYRDNETGCASARIKRCESLLCPEGTLPCLVAP